MMRFESRSEVYAGNAAAFPGLPIVAQIEIIKQMVADIDGNNSKDPDANFQSDADLRRSRKPAGFLHLSYI